MYKQELWNDAWEWISRLLDKGRQNIRPDKRELIDVGPFTYNPEFNDN